MSSVKDAIEAAKQFRGEQITPPTPSVPAPSVDGPPSRNTMLRTPLPVLYKTDPDSQRQWYNGGQVPQSRIMTPLPATLTGNVSVTENAFIAGGGSGGGSSTTSGQPVLFTNQSIVVTPQLSPGQKYIGSTTISNTFQLLGLFSGTAARIQLYGSAAAQQADLARPLDVAPPAGTVSGLITDVALDTAPYLWNFQNSIAANAEEPQTGTIYITITNIGLTTSICTATILYVALSLGLSPDAPALSVTPGGVISNLQLANSSQFAFLNTSNQFSGTISAPAVSVNQASGLQIANSQIQSADLADSTNLAYLNTSNVFTGAIEAPVISANTSAGLQVNGSQVSSVDLSDSTNIAYLNVTNNFTGTINAPVVDVNSAAGLKVSGSQISSGTLSDSSNLAYLNVSNTFTGAINAPVVDVATSAGLTVAGTQLSSINLLDSGNLALLNGVNVFTNTVTAPTLNITGSAANVFTGPVSAAKITSTGSAASVFTGPVTSAQFTQASGSTSTCTFNGTVNAATFDGDVTTVNLTCTGGTVDFTGSGLTVTEINTFAPPTESYADKTLNHVTLSTVSYGLPTAPLLADLATTPISWSVTSNGVSDVFDIAASLSFAVLNGTAVSGYAYGLVDGVIATLFGFGRVDVPASSSGGPVRFIGFIGNVSGLSAGTHTIQLYFGVQGMFTPPFTSWTTSPGTYLSISSSYGQLQQISS